MSSMNSYQQQRQHNNTSLVWLQERASEAVTTCCAFHRKSEVENARLLAARVQKCMRKKAAVARTCRASINCNSEHNCIVFACQLHTLQGSRVAHARLAALC
jgi:hypothetical protein